MSDEATMKGAISRIKSLTIDNFRGYTESKTIQCDADFVLIVGPNGHGKTSLIDALTLLLTGHNIHGGHHKLPSVYRRPNDKGVISAECRTEDGETHRLALSIDGGIDRPFALPGEDQINPELRARLCAFYQDRVGFLFDREAKGLTLRDLLEPKPQAIIDIEEWIKSIKDSLILASQSKELRSEWAADETPEALDAALVEAWSPVQDVLRDIADLMGDGWAPLAEGVVTEPATAREAVESRVRGWLLGMGYPAAEIPGDQLMEIFLARLLTVLAGAIEEFKQRAAALSAAARELQAKLDATEAERAALERRYPTLDEDLDWAGGGGHAGLDLLTLFRMLAERSETWRTPPPGSRDELRRIADEFARVAPMEAEKCALVMADWLEPRQRAIGRRLVLDQRITDLTRELEQARSSEAVRRLETARKSLTRTRKPLDSAWRNRWDRYRFDRERDGREQAKKFLIAAGEAAEGVRTFLDGAVPLSKDLRKDLERRADTVLRRFSLVEGMIPLKLSQGTRSLEGNRTSLTFAPTTGEGGERSLDHFSTGQRAQVAVSLLMAQNQAVTGRLGHRVILLDDVSSAYDLSNLAREVLMWRQLAYGAAGKGTTRFQRQLFLCCHHEDMLNMVAELMVPPTRRTMRVLRFKGWSKDKGPDIGEFTVVPSADPADMPGLAKALARF